MIKIRAFIGGIERNGDYPGTSDELLAMFSRAGIKVSRCDETKPIDVLWVFFKTDDKQEQRHD